MSWLSYLSYNVIKEANLSAYALDGRASYWTGAPGRDACHFEGGARNFP